MRLYSGIGLSWMLCAAVALSEEPAPDKSPVADQQANINAAFAITRECARQYEMSGASGSALTWESRPILKWSNPEKGQVYGNVFLWTQNGRPQVAGSLFKWFSPFTHMSHEFQSLAAGPITARYDAKIAWMTTEPGVRFVELPEAPAVADAAAARLIQMRQLSRRFTVQTTDREGQQHQLRLLAQPVYRYELKDNADVVDGGLFVFVEGTDPEVWLLLEAHRPGDSGDPHWTYAFARMNSIAMSAELDGRSVWTQDVLPWAAVTSHRETYTSFLFKQPSP